MTTPSMPWIKLYTDFLDDAKVGRLSRDAKLLFLQLLLIAGQCDADGMLLDGGDALTLEDIAWRLRESVDDVRRWLDALIACGLVAIEDGAIVIPKFCKRQGRSQADKRAQWAESKRRKRQERKESNESPTGHEEDALDTSNAREEKRRGEEKERTSPPPSNVYPLSPAASISDYDALERERQERAARLQDDTFSNAAVKVHSEVMGVPLTYDQRLEIAEKVKDCEVWRMTLDFWRLRGWQKPNVKGQIDRYKESLANASAGRPHAGSTRPAAQMTAADKQTAPTMRPPLRYEEQPDGSMLPIYADEVKA